jgi:hypothetical protein
MPTPRLGRNTHEGEPRARSARDADVALVVVAALLLVGCRLLRPETASPLSIEVVASRDGFEWTSPEDQLACATAPEYPASVATVLHDALSDGCGPCRGRQLSFRLLLLNEPVGGRARVVSLVLSSPDPQESAHTLAELSGVLSRTRLPPVPMRRTRCTLEVVITPARVP